MLSRGRRVAGGAVCMGGGLGSMRGRRWGRWRLGRRMMSKDGHLVAEPPAATSDGAGYASLEFLPAAVG